VSGSRNARSWDVQEAEQPGGCGSRMRRAPAPTTPRRVGADADGGIEPRRVASMRHGPRNRGSRNPNRDTADRPGLRARTPSVRRPDRGLELSRSSQPAGSRPPCKDRKPPGGNRHRPKGQTSSSRKSTVLRTTSSAGWGGPITRSSRSAIGDECRDPFPAVRPRSYRRRATIVSAERRLSPEAREPKALGRDRAAPRG
jgi:hypothetical protein